MDGHMAVRVLPSKQAYGATRAALSKLEDALRQDRAATSGKHEDPALREAIRRGLEVQASTLSDELELFERLCRGAVPVLSLASLDQIGDLLIAARIAAGLSQQQLAA